MIAGVLGSKPNEILLSFQDRIEAQMRSLQWHGRPTSLSKALAKPAREPRLGATKVSGAATSSDQRCCRRRTVAA
jgi:hypothetical protein